MQLIERILVVAQLRQEDVKEGYDTHLLQPFRFSFLALMYPHVVGRLVVVIDVNPSHGFWTRRLMKLFGHEGK
jgi:hypothetical protein